MSPGPPPRVSALRLVVVAAALGAVLAVATTATAPAAEAPEPPRVPVLEPLGDDPQTDTASTAAAEADRDRLDSRRRALATIRDEIERLEASLEEARSRERTLEEHLDRVEIELDLQRQRIAEARAARDLAEARVEEARRRVEALEQTLAEARVALSRRLLGLYRLGAQGRLRLVLAVDPGSDLVSAIRLLRYLVRRDAAAVERYVESRDRLADQRRRLEGERTEVAAWLGREEEERDRLAAVRSRQDRLLARARSERRDLAARADALVDKEQKLANLIDFVVGRAAAPLSGTPIDDFHGVLDWPVAGEVSRPFGPRRDPRYGTVVPHNGIEITPAASPVAVRAVFPGEVLYAAPFEGWGDTVIVHHPGRVFTLYAGLDELSVGEGAMLELGDTVGTGAGPVYFEIRRDNRPEDPLDWLR